LQSQALLPVAFAVSKEIRCAEEITETDRRVARVIQSISYYFQDLTPILRTIDEALEILSAYGPDLSNGLTSHAPMVAETLCAMGRPEAVLPWVERYRKGMLPWPAAHERISRDDWRSALAQVHRVGDWRAFFQEELHSAPWRAVLDRWVGRLAPGICASATHGVIRVGHAARGLAESESPLTGKLGDVAQSLPS
jgi:hypothetical protein